MSTDDQNTKWRRNIAKNFNRMSRAPERYRRQTDRRQTTDGRATAYSERELTFTLAKHCMHLTCFPCEFLNDDDRYLVINNE